MTKTVNQIKTDNEFYREGYKDGYKDGQEVAREDARKFFETMMQDSPPEWMNQVPGAPPTPR